MIAPTPKITFVDRRGTDSSFPYGFIYFDDGSWLGYLPRGKETGVHLYPGKDGVGNSLNHYQAAIRWLKRKW